MEVKARAPGKIILSGEHAVVHGSTAVAASIGLYTYVSLRFPTSSENDNTLKLQFKDLSLDFSWPIGKLKEALPDLGFPFSSTPTPCSTEAISSISVLVEELNIPEAKIGLSSGISAFLWLYSAFLWLYSSIIGFKPATVFITSELPLGSGLGSSAALCVALSAALLSFSDSVNLDLSHQGWLLFGENELELLNKWAFEGEKIIHGRPSGIDNTVSTYDKFCYNCIVHWTKVVTSKHSYKLSSVKCPLCKMENFSVIHAFDGSSFQQYYINQNFENGGFILTKAHKYRLQCYYTEPGSVSDIFNISRYWKSSKYLQPNCWLRSWLTREIQALIQDEDVEVIIHHILGVISSFMRRNVKHSRSETPEAKEEEFQALISDAARPFLAARSDRFVNEMELFLASGLNIEAYDAVYKQRLGWSAPGVTSETTGEAGEQRPIIPYLYIFDEDSDGTE